MTIFYLLLKKQQFEKNYFIFCIFIFNIFFLF